MCVLPGGEEGDTGPKIKVGKKKLITKLTRKQKLRKDKKRTMGETLADRADAKGLKDRRKADRILRAKTLW